MRSYWVYILASRPRGTLYVGVTRDLVRRVYENREGTVEGFTNSYRVKMLVYYEEHTAAIAAIQREKNIKHRSRRWKIDLICPMNPTWRDLWEDIIRWRRRSCELAFSMDHRVKPGGDERKDAPKCGHDD